MTNLDYNQLSRVIAVANGKGGVFKSSVAANLAGLAAAAGYATLLVDMDPQGDLGDDLGYFADDRDDRGAGLAGSLLMGGSLPVSIPGVRPNLDVVTGGPALADVAGALVARGSRGASTTDLLAHALVPMVGEYAVIIVDTPPVDASLQGLALGAARWLLVPARADASSIKGITSIAKRVVETRTEDHQLDLLGVILAGVATSATRVRADALEDIRAVLGGLEDTLIPHVIRDSGATARECRDRGLLAHELAEKVEGAAPYWEALRAGRRPERLPGSAPALADDYVAVTQYVLQRLDSLEKQKEAVGA